MQIPSDGSIFRGRADMAQAIVGGGDGSSCFSRLIMMSELWSCSQKIGFKNLNPLDIILSTYKLEESDC